MSLHQALQRAFRLVLFTLVLTNTAFALTLTPRKPSPHCTLRRRTPLNTNWRFHRFEVNPDNLVYDIRPDHEAATNLSQADLHVLKPYILPSANDFIADPANHHQLPSNNAPDAPYAQPAFDDSAWDAVTLPHDWAAVGPFYVGDDVPVGGGMGRLPVQGVGWYRRTLNIPSGNTTTEEEGVHYFLDIDGAMSYAMVWLNGKLLGGWPYGYNSFRVDLTPFLRRDGEGENVLAVRVDNPVQSSRWYPGGGIYRNVWLTKVGDVHVPNWGTVVTTREVSAERAVVDLVVGVENRGGEGRKVEVVTEVYALDQETGKKGAKVAEFERATLEVGAGEKTTLNGSVVVENPRLWGPWTSQTPNLYVAVSRLWVDNRVVDTYSTGFGIRSLVFDGNRGLIVNGERVRIQGVNQHHDLGALGAAFNYRAAERQLEVLRDLGCNAIRMAHNPPAPELLELTDRMGFLVVNEIFDSWHRSKNPNDFSLIFADWAEPDLRAFLRRDRNHPSIIAWSVGNEVGEQYTDAEGAAVGRYLRTITLSEDPTRPVTASMNYAKPNMPFPAEFDLISLNYQGEGIRDAPAYAHLDGIKTSPQYPSFHETFPNKLIFSSETAAAVSSRGEYILPITNETSAPVNHTLPPSSGGGGNPDTLQVSAYELYTAPFGSSADKVFATQDAHPYVGGEFVWAGWDYLGEPTPYYDARSSYFGIVDLAGFKKDRFWLYQARWRPELDVVHVLPHWSWGEERVGVVTPVHVFANADEVELWVNDTPQGRITSTSPTTGTTSYRFRFDNITYTPGTLRAVSYRNGTQLATTTVHTAGPPTALRLTADRSTITNSGSDLSFITVEVIDGEGNVVPTADTTLSFEVDGPGELAATDNGNPADMTSFASAERKAFNGLALGIVRGVRGGRGEVRVRVTGDGVEGAEVVLMVQ